MKADNSKGHIEDGPESSSDINVPPFMAAADKLGSDF